MESVHRCIVRFLAGCDEQNHIFNHPRLNELIDAASKLAPSSYVELKRHQFEGILEDLFICTLHTVARVIAEGRAGYASAAPTGADLKCVSVGNNGWNSEQSFFLGASATFMHRRTFKSYRVALGLVQPKSHDQDDVFEATMEVLKRYGLSKGDVKFSSNDTTNSAVSASRQISGGEEGTCMMHVINLVAEQEIGKRTRSVNKNVVCSLPELEDLRKKGRGSMGYIFSKKSKKRYELYVLRNKNERFSVFRCSVDSDTIISGTHRMYCMLLRSRFSFEIYFRAEGNGWDLNRLRVLSLYILLLELMRVEG